MNALTWTIVGLAVAVLVAIGVAIALSDGDQRVQRALAQFDADRQRYAERSIGEVDQMRDVRGVLFDDRGALTARDAILFALGAACLLVLLCGCGLAVLS